MTDSMVPVEGVPCFHDGAHPDGHVVSLRPKLTLEAAVYIRRRIIPVADDWDRVTARLMEGYARFGPAEVDGIPITDEDVELLVTDQEAGLLVAERGDALYSVSLLAPFLRVMRERLQDSPTDESTSPPKDGSPKPRKRSKRSSTSTSPTDSTEPTSIAPVSDSSSSES